MFKKVIGIVLFCSLTIFSIAYGKSDTKITEKEVDPNILFKTGEEINYTIRTNEMIDTYIIASAVYMDFNSPVLQPNTENNAIYIRAKNLFCPYKNHNFLKDFDKYVFNGDINGDAIGVLLSYSPTPSLDKICEVDEKYRNYIFKDNAEINSFIEGLKSFYKDTNAKEFFENNKGLVNSVKSYVKYNIKDSRLIELIKSTEEYVNTKDKYFGDLPIEYETVLTIYRPSMASFYSYKTDSSNKIVTVQSPNDFTQDPYKLDINYMVENVIHEYLHSYINKPIYDITTKKCTDTSKYYSRLTNNTLYSNMPVYRQVDEYLVRAIQGRIYTQAFGEKYTFDRLLNKEIKYGGFERLEEVYNYLSNYEADRNKFPTIDDFLPELVEKLTRRVE
jgi:hypothetical protein